MDSGSQQCEIRSSNTQRLYHIMHIVNYTNLHLTPPIDASANERGVLAAHRQNVCPSPPRTNDSDLQSHHHDTLASHAFIDPNDALHVINGMAEHAAP